MSGFVGWAAVAVATALALSTSCGWLGQPPPLANTRSSPALLARTVLAALAARDEATLRAVALSEQEFRGHVWPELPAARPERNLSFGYVWSDLRQKSDARLRQTLARHGGQRYELLRLTYGGATTRYGTCTVHRETTLVVRDAAGDEQAIRAYGSTLEQAGAFKVFSYVVDD